MIDMLVICDITKLSGKMGGQITVSFTSLIELCSLSFYPNIVPYMLSVD